MGRDLDGDGRVRAPVRTCLGCRERAPKRELLRVVARGSDSGIAVVPDPGARAPGRGGYLHPTLECLELAMRRRAFARALRVPGKLDEAPVRDHLRLALEQ